MPRVVSRPLVWEGKADRYVAPIQAPARDEVPMPCWAMRWWHNGMELRGPASPPLIANHHPGSTAARLHPARSCLSGCRGRSADRFVWRYRLPGIRRGSGSREQPMFLMERSQVQHAVCLRLSPRVMDGVAWRKTSPSVGHVGCRGPRPPAGSAPGKVPPSPPVPALEPEFELLEMAPTARSRGDHNQ